MLNWKELLVTDGAGDVWGTLGEIVAFAPANLDSATLNPKGELNVWFGYFVHAEGEIPTADTPEVPVDWSGFKEALGR